jgi:hypothetical protein
VGPLDRGRRIGAEEDGVEIVAIAGVGLDLRVGGDRGVVVGAGVADLLLLGGDW